MPSLEGVKLYARKHYIRMTSKRRRKVLNSFEFTIISNNCWGGFIYQSYGLPYMSPTIGLYFMAGDYIKFVSRLKHYIECDLNFIEPNDSRYCHLLKKDKRYGTYPIGRLDDIEVIFLHYMSEEEAYRKWNRRCERINYDKLLVKFNDQNGCRDEHVISFDGLDFKNKVCFTSKEYPDLGSVVYVSSAKGQKYISGLQEPYGQSKYININELLNTLK